MKENGKNLLVTHYWTMANESLSNTRSGERRNLNNKKDTKWGAYTRLSFSSWVFKPFVMTEAKIQTPSDTNNNGIKNGVGKCALLEVRLLYFAQRDKVLTLIDC